MLRIIAILTMLVDHAGLIFFDNAVWMRSIGRISMPIFAWGIASGYVHTKEKGTLKPYVRRLVLFSLVSQLPYMLAFETTVLNIGFAYLIAMACFYLADQYPRIGLLLILPVSLLAEFIPCDGGMFTVLTAVQCYLVLVKRDFPAWCLLACFPVYFLWSAAYGLPWFMCAWFAYPLIYVLRNYEQRIRLPRQLSYSVYPVHLAIYGVLRLMLGITWKTF